MLYIDGFRRLFKRAKKIRGFLKIVYNKNLEDISFLDGLESVYSSLYLHHNNLKSLDGLQKLKFVGASFSISTNKISSLKPLSSLVQVNGCLNFYNNNLTTLDGLENLKILKTVKWNKKNITINLSSNNLIDIKALANIQTQDRYIIMYIDNIYKVKKPPTNSKFFQNILEIYSNNEYIPTFKIIKKTYQDYSYFRKTTHNKLLDHIFDFEVFDAEVLVISFVGYNGFLGGLFYNKFPLITNNIKTHKIFIHDKKNSWYHSGIPNLTNNIIQTIEFINKISHLKKYKKIVCFGASMGAYMSLLTGKIIKANKIVVFAPQTFLDKENRKIYNENRWKNDLDKKIPQDIDKKYLDLNVLYQDGCDDVDIEIHYAKNLPLDLIHINHLQAKCIKKIGYEIDSHYVSIYLRNIGKIDKIIKKAIRK